MLDFGFNGYQVPEVPRSCRSARGRGPIRNKCEGTQNHSFEILASVAGKLLERSESSLHVDAGCAKKQKLTCDNIISRREEDEGQLLNEEVLELGRSTNKTVDCDPGFQDHRKKCSRNEFFYARDNSDSETNPTSKDFSLSGTINSDEKNAFDDSSFVPDVIEGKVQGVPERKHKAEPITSSSGNVKDETVTVTGSLDDLMKMEGKSSKLVSPGHDGWLSFTKDCKNYGPFTKHTSNIQVDSRDDDESVLGSTHPGTTVKAFGPPPGTGNKRIKKISANRHFRVAPDVKEGNYCCTDGKIKEVYSIDRTCYTHEKTQKIYPFKKRKFFNHDPLSTSNRQFSLEGSFNPPEERINGKSYTAAIGAPSSMAGQQVTPNSNECNVKLSIKSFKVPELFIDIPETATVGSLKRTVMEAMTSILGDGLHVGILVQGKKVRDDSKTLIQTGISQDDKHHNLGFFLEPKNSQTGTSQCIKNKSLLSKLRSRGLTRHSVSLTLQQGTSNDSLHPSPNNLGGYVESDLSPTPTLADSLSNTTNNKSKALVVAPKISVEPLAMVPFHRKSGHHDYVQRRMRRPFSVSEVEALVRAVEKLGTGRWRDVKFHAFDDAKHRTYVDLKDKWKTLVHTARISPQQRRGEPVPQELLDRVLAAQAYWSHRQAKQQAKVSI